MKPCTRLLILLLLCTAMLLGAPQTTLAGRVMNDSLVTNPFRHHIFQEVINESVAPDGSLYLVKLRARPKRLNEYLDQLAAVSPENRPDYFPTRNESLAYWINAHNAMALRQALDIYPADAMDAALLNKAHYRLGGKRYSLAGVRHKIAADFSQTPNTLFALSDLSMDSPRLSTHVYKGDTLALQLEQAQRRVISDAGMIRFVPGECMGIELSPYLEGFQPLLFAGVPGNPDAALGAPLPPEHALATGQATPAGTALVSWVDVLRPFAPPAAYAELGRPCLHPVSFRDPDARLRLLR